MSRATVVARWIVGRSIVARAIRDGSLRSLVRNWWAFKTSAGHRLGTPGGIKDRAIGVAMVGFGRQASSVLLPSLRAVSRFEILMVVVKSRQTMERARANFSNGVDVARDLRSALSREDIVAVVLGVPSSLQEVMTARALESGKHVYCEAPGITSERRGAALERISHSVGKILMYGYRYHHAPHYRRWIESAQQVVARSRECTLDIWAPEKSHMYTLSVELFGRPESAIHGADSDGEMVEVGFDGGRRLRWHPLPDEVKREDLVLQGDGGRSESRLSESPGSPARGAEESSGMDLAYPESFSARGVEAPRDYLEARGFIHAMSRFADSIDGVGTPICGVSIARGAARLYNLILASRVLGKARIRS